MSHFISFNEDKYARPEFFAWPGAWMVGSKVDTSVERLFDKHRALFSDKEDDDGIFPRVYDDKPDDIVHKVFQSFYEANVNYDMTAQWIDQYGPFQYHFDWLASGGTPEMIKEFANSVFEHAYGTDPAQFLLGSYC